MLHRVTARDDPHLPRVLRLRERLDAKPLTGSGLPSVTIGRSETLNDFALYCENFPIVVSRRHATVTFDGEVYRLEDNNACNGTVINDLALPRYGSAVLRVGDVVSFGGAATFMREGAVLHNPFRFVFVEADAPAQPAAAPEPSSAPELAPPARPSGGTRAQPGRRRAREDDAIVPPPATRRRTALLAALHAAAAVPEPPPAADDAPLAPIMESAFHIAANVAAAAEAAAALAPASVSAPPAPPPLPTFEPLSVPPLPAGSVGALVAGMAAECMCCICYDLLVAPHVTACSHVFCGECITKALKVKPTSCPECRGRPGKPCYDRKLDALLCGAVEPSLEGPEAETRTRRKRVWQDMQLAAAIAEREGGPPLFGAAPRGRVGAPGLTHGAPARGISYTYASAADDDVTSWRVDCAPAGARMVCHGCFDAMQPGDLRVLREVMPVNSGAAGALSLPRARDFFHIHCRPGACPGPEGLQGMNALPAPLRVTATAALAVPPQSQPAPAAM